MSAESLPSFLPSSSFRIEDRRGILFFHPNQRNCPLLFFFRHSTVIPPCCKKVPTLHPFRRQEMGFGGEERRMSAEGERKKPSSSSFFSSTSSSTYENCFPIFVKPFFLPPTKPNPSASFFLLLFLTSSFSAKVPETPPRTSSLTRGYPPQPSSSYCREHDQSNRPHYLSPLLGPRVWSYKGTKQFDFQEKAAGGTDRERRKRGGDLFN